MLLPKIDVHGGRGPTRREAGHARDADPSAVVPLPRLRLLKQVGGDEQPVAAVAPPAPQRKPPSGGFQPGTYLTSSDDRPDSHQQLPRRGRGLLRPLDSDGEVRLPGRSRSPPPQPRAAQGFASGTSGEDEDTEMDNSALLLQQRARERVKQERRQRRRAAKEEEEKRQQEEQDRLERAQKNASQVEAHRRELARGAAERSRRAREDREAAMQEREELQSARRERMARYMTPDKIRELRHKDDHEHADEQGSSSEVASDQLPMACSECGNSFMPDALFCRKCGAKRPTSKQVCASEGIGGPAPPRRAARAPSTDPPSRRPRRRRSEDNCSGRHRRGQNHRRGSPESGCRANDAPGESAGPASGEDAVPPAGVRSVEASQTDNSSAIGKVGDDKAVSSASRDYYKQHVLKDVNPSGWAVIHAPFLMQHATHRTAPAQGADKTAVGKVNSLPAVGDAVAAQATNQIAADELTSSPAAQDAVEVVESDLVKLPLATPDMLFQDLSVRKRIQVALAAALASGSLARTISDVSSEAPCA